MKIRSGFVSNSSSSSFIVYGTFIPDGSLCEDLKDDMDEEAEKVGLKLSGNPVGPKDEYFIGEKILEFDDCDNYIELKPEYFVMSQDGDDKIRENVNKFLSHYDIGLFNSEYKFAIVVDGM